MNAIAEKIVADRVNAIIRIFGIEPKDVSFTNFFNGDIANLLEVDSCNAVEIVQALEVEFNIDIPDGVLSIHTIPDMVNYIDRRINS